MCGQFYISNDILKATRNYAPISHFEQEQLHFGTIYPSAKTLVLCRQEDHIAAKIMRFGIEYKGFKKALINARSETVLSKWMFRCALFMNGQRIKRRSSLRVRIIPYSLSRAFVKTISLSS